MSGGLSGNSSGHSLCTAGWLAVLRGLLGAGSGRAQHLCSLEVVKVARGKRPVHAITAREEPGGGVAGRHQLSAGGVGAHSPAASHSPVIQRAAPQALVLITCTGLQLCCLVPGVTHVTPSQGSCTGSTSRLLLAVSWVLPYEHLL